MRRYNSSRIAVLLLVYILVINISYLLGLYSEFSSDLLAIYEDNYIKSTLIINSIYLVVFYTLNLYVDLWIYLDGNEFLISIGSSNLAHILVDRYVSIRAPNVIFI